METSWGVGGLFTQQPPGELRVYVKRRRCISASIAAAAIAIAFAVSPFLGVFCVAGFVGIFILPIKKEIIRLIEGLGIFIYGNNFVPWGRAEALVVKESFNGFGLRESLSLLIWDDYGIKQEIELINLPLPKRLIIQMVGTFETFKKRAAAQQQTKL